MKFIIEMNHSKCMERYKGKQTVLECLKFESIKLSDLKSIYNDNTPIHFLRSWLLQLNLFVNVDAEKKLSEDQIIELSGFMYKEIYMLNMAELTLLFERIKTGFYFPFYNRIDATQLMSACRMFRKERSKHLIEIEQNKEWVEHLKRLEIKVKSSKSFLIKSRIYRNHTRKPKTKQNDN